MTPYSPLFNIPTMPMQRSGGMMPPQLPPAPPVQMAQQDPMMQMGMGLLGAAKQNGPMVDAGTYPWQNFLSWLGYTQPYQGMSQLGQGMASGGPYGLLSMFGGPR